MNKRFFVGFLFYAVSIFLVSIGFKIPYQLELESLLKNFNFSGFDLLSSVKMLGLLVILSLILALIPFRNIIFKIKFSNVFMILNIVFLLISIFISVEITITGSKVLCEYKNF